MAQEFFYRYRSTESLFGFHELERQGIFFASPTQLNDPMEGYQDVFWSGDSILWINLLRHYTLCLLNSISVCNIMREDFKPAVILPVLRWSASNLPTKILRDQLDEVFGNFLLERGLLKIIERLSRIRQKVHRDELMYYISCFHSIVFEHALAHFSRRGMLPLVAALPSTRELVVKSINRLSLLLDATERATPEERHAMPSIFDLNFRTFNQGALLASYNTPHTVVDWPFVAFHFPDFYCRNVASILFAPWFAACFARNAQHAAMWGHYGTRHQGVCLKFKAAEDVSGQPTIRLQQVAKDEMNHDQSEQLKGPRSFQFVKVTYSTKFPEVDFFQSLGLFSRNTLMLDWFTHKNRRSETTHKFVEDIEAWRKTYNDNYLCVATTKFDDWSSEEEYRLVLSDTFWEHQESRDRRFKYRFDDLSGIIFGANTSNDEKIRIIKIVDQKCTTAGRKDFEFLQASYSSHSGRFDVHPLTLIRVEP